MMSRLIFCCSPFLPPEWKSRKESGPFFFVSPFLGTAEFNLVIFILTAFLLEWSAVNDIRLTKSSGGGKKEGEEGKKNIP